MEWFLSELGGREFVNIVKLIIEYCIKHTDEYHIRPCLCATKFLHLFLAILELTN